MATFLIVIHVFVCLFLIFIVLIQGGKGAEIGAAFGGASQTVFGSRGAATFLGKMTTIVAAVFMLTSLLLAVVSMRSASVVKPAAPASEANQPFTQPLTQPQDGSPIGVMPTQEQTAPSQKPDAAKPSKQ